ncbi:DUF4124 domain-containing protein, partial [Piscirickettsia litoralis]|uniref:DUF4124 domain-containing protein n=1 Tax=Piscirickettsia litoralis TaxID=1891921 RepID=UPI001112D7A1
MKANSSTYLLLFSLSFSLASIHLNTSHGAVYSWQDTQGVTHFSNQPHTGSKQLHLSEPIRFPTSPTLTATTIKNSPQLKTATHDNYLSIISPKNNQSINNAAGNIKIKLKPLSNTDTYRYYYYIDNKLIKES